MVNPVVVQQTVLKTLCGVDRIATTFDLNYLSFGSEQLKIPAREEQCYPARKCYPARADNPARK